MFGCVWKVAAIALCLAGYQSGAFGQPVSSEVAACEQRVDPERRIEACTAIIDDRRTSRDDRFMAYLRRLNGYIRKREFDAAVDDATRAMQLDPESAAAVASRGDAHRGSGALDKAIADYTAALKLNPGYAVAYNNRGFAWRQKGDSKRAIEDFSQAVEIDPQFALGFKNRADMHRETGDLKQALADYDQALKLDPGIAGVTRSRETVLKALRPGQDWEDCKQDGEQERRIAGCTALLAKDDLPAERRFAAFHNRSIAFGIIGTFDRAIADASEAVRLRPDSPWAWGNRGDALRKNDDFDAALADYSKAIALKPDYAMAFNNRGVVWRKKAQSEKAIADFSKAIELNPKLEVALANRAAIREAQADYLHALEDYEAVLALDADHPSAVSGRDRVQALVPKPRGWQGRSSSEESAGAPQAAPPAAAFRAERRIALVIGIDTYKNFNPLAAARNDAAAVAEVLEKDLGFDKVLSSFDVSYAAMSTRISDLEQEIRPGDTVFFFFSGHGVGVGGENYLMPSDAPMPTAGREGEVEDLAFSVQRIVNRILRRKARVAILVLDACRNDPFATAQATRSVVLSETRGLVRAEPPDGVFVMYAAAAGQVSYDRLGPSDKDRNSVFTRVFLEEIRKPRVLLHELARTTRNRVFELARSANKVQKPAIYDELLGDFILAP